MNYLKLNFYAADRIGGLFYFESEKFKAKIIILSLATKQLVL